jgi:hypothetical protein
MTRPTLEALSEADFLALLNQRIEEAGSATAWARKHGIHVSFVLRVAKGEQPPGKSIPLALGFKPVTSYVWGKRS